MSNYAQMTPHITLPLSKLQNPPVCADGMYFLRAFFENTSKRAENASEITLKLYGRRNLHLKNASNI